MKKTIFMIALIVGASLGTVNATEGENSLIKNHKVTVVKALKVNPFCAAIAKGDYDMVKKMIRFGEDIDAFSNGKTPLMYAARYNKSNIVALLIENGADLTIKDNHGKTAKDYAKMSKAKDALQVIAKALKK